VWPGRSPAPRNTERSRRKLAFPCSSATASLGAGRKGRWVKTCSAKRMAPPHAFEGQPRSLSSAMSRNHLKRVSRTARLEPTGSTHEGTQHELVGPHDEERGARRELHAGLAARSRLSAAANSASRREKGALIRSRLAITTMSIAWSPPARASSGRWRRNTSRSRLFARFRRTAPPIRREATMPSLSWGRWFGAPTMAKYRVDRRRPRSSTAVNSRRARSRTLEVNLSDIP
jgi:hypothetical protein